MVAESINWHRKYALRLYSGREHCMALGEALIGTENMRGYADSIMNKPLSPELMSDV